jgi:hypothetical protein
LHGKSIERKLGGNLKFHMGWICRKNRL